MTRILVDTEKCVCCGDCVAICPVRVYNRIVPPCQAACPIGTDAEGYLSLIAQGKFPEALELNRQVNPLPLVVGRVCNHPCESKCHRGKVDEPVAICALKRFVGDQELLGGRHTPPKAAPRTRAEKVAVIGAGPVGLAAAHSLVRMGYGVTVFEAEPVAGGMLYWGIPEFRLPRQVLALEIDDIRALGVEFRLNTPVGANPAMEDLRAQGYQAVLLAIGVQQCRVMGIPGEAGAGVLHCLDLMKKVARGEKVAVGRNVVVIGGGNVAIDGARTVVRLGAQKVTLVCLESRDTMPAGAYEVAEAEEEGISVLPARQCLQVRRSAGGSITGLECVKLASMRFEAGNLITEPIAGTEHTVKADMLLVAIGQAPDLRDMTGLKPEDVARSGRIAVNPVTMATSEPWLFAAGDAVTGPASVVEAVAAGKKAAASIDRYLRGEKAPPPPPSPGVEELAPAIDQLWGEIRKMPRVPTARLPEAERTSTFKEVDRGYGVEEAMTEARRCLGCGVFGVVDIASCCTTTCRLCVDNCWKQALTVVRTPPAAGAYCPGL